MKPSTLSRKIADTARSLSDALKESDLQLSELRQSRLDLETKRSICYSEIARCLINSDAIISVERVRTILAQRGTEMARVRSELTDLEKRIGEQDALIEPLRADYQKAVAALRDALTTLPGYRVAKDELDGAATTVLRAGELATEIEAEVAAKSPLFNSPFFIYLRQRGYGTPEARGNVVTKRLDALLAERIGFQANAQALDSLNEMGTAARGRLDLAKSAHEAAAERVSQLEVNHPLNATVRKLHEQITKLELKSQTWKKLALEAKEALQAFASGTDSHMSRAVDYLSGSMKDMPIERIEQQVLATPSAEDDDLLAQIKALSAQISDLDKKIALADASRQEVADKRDRARRLERTFEQNNLGAGGYSYRSGLDADGLVTGFILGSMSERSVVDTIRSHRVEDEPVRSSSSYSGSSSSWSDSSSFSSLDSASSSSSGSDSFSTSDSF